ncbi:MAG: hypothetical protein IIT58_01020, partial [Treponema sp.]|nr:hypothetical protein [Treponema sp.]
GDWQEIYDAEQANWVYNFPTDAEHSKDGFNVIWFKVVDAKNTTFVSSVSNAKDLSAPKLGSRDVTFGSEENLYSTVLYAKVDLKAPTIPIASYSTDTKYENYTSEQLAAIFDGEHIKAQYSVDWKELSTLSEKIGGDTKALYVLVLGKDSNGIQELSCLFGDSSDNITSGPENAGCIVTDANGNKAQLFKVNLGASDYANKEGKYNLSVKAIDNAGAQSSLHFEVDLDNKAPVVTLITPSTDGVKLYGSASQNITGQTADYTGVKELYFGVSQNEGTEPSSYSEDLAAKISTAMWQVTFDGSGSESSVTQYYTSLFNTYIDSIYGENYHQTNDNVELCIWFYAVDTLGNSGLSSPVKRTITVLTQGDKPTVKITYPTKGSTVGGAITVTGTTQIATSEVDKVYIQISTDGGTNFGEPIEVEGSTQSWYKIINDSGEYNHEGGNTALVVKAYAISKTDKRSDDTEDSATNFEIDPNSPVFGDKESLRLVQYSDNEK